jgi:hypothetical protein
VELYVITTHEWPMTWVYCRNNQVGNQVIKVTENVSCYNDYYNNGTKTRSNATNVIRKKTGDMSSLIKKHYQGFKAYNRSHIQYINICSDKY